MSVAIFFDMNSNPYKLNSSSSSATISGQIVTNRDIQTIVQERKCTYLSIRECAISDEALDEFGDLTEIVSLTIESCTGLSNLDFLAALTNLRSLTINDCEITDISALGNLSGLERLSLQGNQISNISVLAFIEELQVLDLSQNQITDLTPLSTQTGLTECNVSDNQLQSL